MPNMALLYGLLVLGAASVATGCAPTVSFQPTNRAPQPLVAREPSSVEVFTAAPPAGPFVEVGIIEAREGGKYSARTNLVDVIRRRAAEAGCDAIIVTGAADEVVGRQSQTSGTISTVRGLRAACIVYSPPRAASPATAAPIH